MLAYAGTDIIVADAHQADGVAHILGQPVGVYTVGQLVDGDKLEADGDEKGCYKVAPSRVASGRTMTECNVVS